MYHSITIGTKNTWDDWHLIPSSRPSFSPPSFRSDYIEIPGGNGSLDLSVVLLGEPLYNNREGSVEFYVMHDEWLKDEKSWADSYSEVMSYIHGNRFKATLEDDPNFYYEGRWTVNDWKTDMFTKITLDYNLYPYKFKQDETVIQRTINGTTDVEITSDRMTVVPTIIAEIASGDSLRVEGIDIGYLYANGSPLMVNGDSYLKVQSIRSSRELVNGPNVFPTMPLYEGENTLRFTGKGKVTIRFREGRL